MSSNNDIERAISLIHEDGSQTSMEFVATQPEEWVVFIGEFVQVFLPLRFFEDTVRLLQTEAPIRLLARADDDPRLFFVQLSSIAEQPGEGPADADTVA
jgi:hypothetical protein